MVSGNAIRKAVTFIMLVATVANATQFPRALMDTNFTLPEGIASTGGSPTDSCPTEITACMADSDCLACTLEYSGTGDDDNDDPPTYSDCGDVSDIACEDFGFSDTCVDNEMWSTWVGE